MRQLQEQILRHQLGAYAALKQSATRRKQYHVSEHPLERNPFSPLEVTVLGLSVNEEPFVAGHPEDEGVAEPLDPDVKQPFQPFSVLG